MGYLAALNRHDLAEMDARFTPDVVIHDHRPLSFGVLERDAYLSSFPTLWERAPDARWMIRRDLDSADGVLLTDVVMFGSREGGAFASPQHLVGTTRDGQVAGFDVFGIDDLPAARECFAGHVAAGDLNLAVRVVSRTMELLLAGRIGEASEFYGPDMVMHDHRPLVGGVALDREAFEPTAAAIFDWEFDRWERTVLASHGDRLALLQAVFGDATREVEALLLVEADDQGRYRRLDVFDPDQLELAEARYSARAAGPDGA